MYSYGKRYSSFLSSTFLTINKQLNITKGKRIRKKFIYNENIQRNAFKVTSKPGQVQKGILKLYATVCVMSIFM